MESTAAQIFITYERAVPTSDRCLIAPNGDVNVISTQNLGIIFYLGRSKTGHYAQTTVVTRSVQVNTRGNSDTYSIYRPFDIHKATWCSCFSGPVRLNYGCDAPTACTKSQLSWLRK